MSNATMGIKRAALPTVKWTMAIRATEMLGRYPDAHILLDCQFLPYAAIALGII